MTSNYTFKKLTAAQRRKQIADEATANLQRILAQRRAEPVSKDQPVPCDCLDVCGDDPWLQDGRAKKCADYARLHPPSFRCPRCGMVSYHPKDIAEGYCGASCHDFTRDST